MAAIPVGLTLAGALVLAGLGDEPDPASGRSAAGEIEEAVSDDAKVPEAATGDDFFDEPTSTPVPAEPRGDSGPQGAQAIASSSPQESQDEDGGGGSSAGSDSEGAGSPGGGGGSGSSGGGNPGNSQAAGGPQATAVVTLVNEERAANGCGPLSVDGRLTSAAQEHSQDMADRDYMAHESPEGESPSDRARRHGYNAFGAENVAKGQTSAQQVMDAWMNSPGHRANILNCDLSAIGVGVADTAWTQKFGRE